VLTHANLYSTPEVLFRELFHIFVPAFREHRPRQAWIHPPRSLCNIYSSQTRGRTLFLSINSKIALAAKTAVLVRVWNNILAFQYHKNLTVRLPGNRELVGFSGRFRQRVLRTIEERRRICRRCLQRFSLVFLQTR